MTVKHQFDQKASVAVSSSGKTEIVVSQRNEELMKELHTNSLNLYEVGFCRSDLILLCRMIHLRHGRLIDQASPGKVNNFVTSGKKKNQLS